MRFIVITDPNFIPDEAELIVRLFDAGLDTLHLRKPGSAEADCAALIERIPDSLLRRIVTHDHFGLCAAYGLQGVHLNSRNPQPPALPQGATVSASCHSLAEAESRKAQLDYVTLSPVFNSISKQGYQSAYTAGQLSQAAASGTIDSRVVALGGITIGRIAQLREWHFGGAAFLGDVWSHADDPRLFSRHAQELRAALNEE